MSITLNVHHLLPPNSEKWNVVSPDQSGKWKDLTKFIRQISSAEAVGIWAAVLTVSVVSIGIFPLYMLYFRDGAVQLSHLLNRQVVWYVSPGVFSYLALPKDIRIKIESYLTFEELNSFQLVSKENYRTAHHALDSDVTRIEQLAGCVIRKFCHPDMHPDQLKGFLNNTQVINQAKFIRLFCLMERLLRNECLDFSAIMNIMLDFYLSKWTFSRDSLRELPDDLRGEFLELHLKLKSDFIHHPVFPEGSYLTPTYPNELEENLYFEFSTPEVIYRLVHILYHVMLREAIEAARNDNIYTLEHGRPLFFGAFKPKLLEAYSSLTHLQHKWQARIAYIFIVGYHSLEELNDLLPEMTFFEFTECIKDIFGHSQSGLVVWSPKVAEYAAIKFGQLCFDFSNYNAMNGFIKLFQHARELYSFKEATGKTYVVMWDCWKIDFFYCLIEFIEKHHSVKSKFTYEEIVNRVLYCLNAFDYEPSLRSEFVDKVQKIGSEKMKLLLSK